MTAGGGPPLGYWVRARTERDIETFKQDRERVAAEAKPPRLSRRHNVVFWLALAAIMVAGFALGSG